MDIVKTFHYNEFSTNITILGTREEPLFKASDIADILELKNMHSTLAPFTPTEKILQEIDTPGGKQLTTFLTEYGLYRLVLKSNKPFASDFKNWVFGVIKEIRLNGKYELPKELQEELLQSKQRAIELEQQLNDVSQQKTMLEDEMKLMNNMDGRPIIYIFDMDTRVPLSNKSRVLKIGVTEHYQKRFKPYKQIAPFGRMVFHIECQSENMRLTENWINHVLKPFNQAGEVFEMNLELAMKWLSHIANTIVISRNLNFSEMETQIGRIVDVENILLNKTNEVSALVKEISTQTEEEQFEKPLTEHETQQHIQQAIEEQTLKFDKYIEECCLVDPIYEVSSSDVVGQYRLWARSADKPTFHALNDYLQTRFRYIRLPTSNESQVVNGFRGLKLKEIPNTPLPFGASDHELFLAHACTYSPSGKVLMAELLNEYEKWCNSVSKIYNKSEFKNYLKNSHRVLISNVWTANGNGQGYYGLSLKNTETNNKRTSSTAKTVTKRAGNGDIIRTWTTIAKAAQDEGIPPPKLSRAIKNKTIINGFVYVVS